MLSKLSRTSTVVAVANDAIFVSRALRAEIPAIADLVTTGLQRFRGAVPDAALDGYIEQSRDIPARWTHGTVLIARQHDRIVGTVIYYPQAGLGLPTDWASFGTLVVDPDMQRRGIGSILVRRCIAMATGTTSAIGIHTGSFM